MIDALGLRLVTLDTQALQFIDCQNICCEVDKDQDQRRRGTSGPPKSTMTVQTHPTGSTLADVSACEDEPGPTGL